MDLNENGSLAALEYLMEEFFNPATTNSRKHEIEQQLQSFKCQPHLWRLCLYFLTNTSSQYVTMFALTTLESVINQQWTNAEWSLKDELKNVLYSYLIEKGDSAPHFIRGKYAKLLVAIAKRDWPSHYPNFFDNILELMKSEPNQLTALILLRTTSEEFMGIHASFENGRKDEITRLLHHYIPAVFQLLNSVLENLGTKPRHRSTATPPPSPTHPTATPSLSQQLANATFKTDPKVLNKEALDTVQQLFTWVPINQIPPSIIKAIFNYTNISSYAQDDHDMCVLAMSTINELLYRKCTPPGSRDFFIQLYFYTLELLRDITNSSTRRIDNLDPIFVEKLSELLVLMVEQHLWRFELEPGFSAFEFLSLLYLLTVGVPSVQCYSRCLSIWSAFCKQMKPEKCQKYSQVFPGLLAALLKKIQFSHNSAQLKEINQTDTNDDNETDWQIFLKNSIEIIALIAVQVPLETLNEILSYWDGSYEVYRRIEMVVDRQNCSLNCEANESERLCHILTDFSSLTQTLARLCDVYFDQEDEDITNVSTPLINNVIRKIMESASVATSIRFYNLKVSNPRVVDCFIDNHSQLLAALKTYLNWMNVYTEVANLPLIIDISIPSLTVSTPLKISNSAAHLFLGVTYVAFAPNVISMPNVVHFINSAPAIRFADNQINLVMYSAITNLLLKPWEESTDQMHRRMCLTEVFFTCFTNSFRDLTPNTDEGRVRETVDAILPALSHIVDFCKSFPLVTKKKLFTVIQSTIEHSVFLFPAYARLADVSNAILNFFLNVLRVLQQQLGVDFTKKAVQVFLEVAVKEREASNFLDKLLQIFQLVVESPGSTYKNFLPGILHLCMDNVHPYIMSNGTSNPDTFIALLTLLHSVLLHRWQYFYSSQVRLGYSPVYNDPSEGDSPEPTQLLLVLQVFGQGLVQDDINIFRLSLASLEDLNSKWKLYLNVLFRYNGLSKYLTVLIQNLVEKSQSLLSEDIHLAVYNMAAVNFDYFFATFLLEFLRGVAEITDHQREVLLGNFVQNHDKDMPTFVQHLKIFVNDIRHYRLCRLPPGFLGN